MEAQNTDFEEYFITDDIINIAWDINSAGPVEEYKIYYSPHEEANWNFLDTIESTQYSYTLHHSVIGDGSWDFAVSSVDETGAESSMHSSLDQNAHPATGWYVLWLE